MANNRFDVSLEISVFRDIANQLLEQGLITQREFGKIQPYLRRRERVLLTQGIAIPIPHARIIAQKSQVPKGVDRNAQASDDGACYP